MTAITFEVQSLFSVKPREQHYEELIMKHSNKGQRLSCSLALSITLYATSKVRITKSLTFLPQLQLLQED